MSDNEDNKDITKKHEDVYEIDIIHDHEERYPEDQEVFQDDEDRFYEKDYNQILYIQEIQSELKKFSLLTNLKFDDLENFILDNT